MSVGASSFLIKHSPLSVILSTNLKGGLFFVIYRLLIWKTIDFIFREKRSNFPTNFCFKAFSAFSASNIILASSRFCLLISNSASCLFLIPSRYSLYLALIFANRSPRDHIWSFNLYIFCLSSFLISLTSFKRKRSLFLIFCSENFCSFLINFSNFIISFFVFFILSFSK